MPKKPMKATPANVSRLLSTANHSKRTSYPSPIRGWKNWTSGFKCEAQGDHVEVRYLVDGGYDSAPASAKRARLEQYLPALQDHFQCAVNDKDGYFVLTVRERPHDGKE